ncbi:MAG: hypothetical protein ACPGVO_03185 [Spirulinaceae cyanobacterium]
MSEYAIARKKFEEVQKISPEHILISSSTIVFKQSKDGKKGKEFSLFFGIQDIKHIAFCDYKIPKEKPPEFCTQLILTSLVLLFFPGYPQFLGIFGFIILFLILGNVDAKNAKRGKYGLFLSLSGGLEFIVESKHDSFLKTTIQAIDAVRDKHPKMMDYLAEHNHFILDFKDKKIINPTNKEDVGIDFVSSPSYIS